MIYVEVETHPSTKQAARILTEILPGAISLFLAKNKDYAIDGIDIAETLGVRGQWSDMYRKIAKLKQSMWDQNGEGLQFETAEEVVQDLIGHCLLTLLFLKDEETKARRERAERKMEEFGKNQLREEAQAKNHDIEDEEEEEIRSRRPLYARSEDYDDRPAV
jgi:hypothetical protein